MKDGIKKLSDAQRIALQLVEAERIRAVRDDGFMRFNHYRPTMEILLKRGLIRLEPTDCEKEFAVRLTPEGCEALAQAGENPWKR